MSKKKYGQFNCNRLILPEHREKLNHWTQETFFKNPAGYEVFFDEQERERFDDLVNESLNEGKEISLLIKSSKGNYLWMRGVIQARNQEKRLLKINTGQEVKLINTGEIIKIE